MILIPLSVGKSVFGLWFDATFESDRQTEVLVL
jgi:hypothetical protein